jgi:hypothetical protein
VLGIFDLSQPSRATQPHHNNQQGAEETTSGPTVPPDAKPGQTNSNSEDDPAFAAVGDTIKVRLAPVERHVKPDWHPEICSMQQETASNPNAPALKN